MNEKTTDLPIIRSRPGLFIWGKVIKIHDVGPRYTLVEYDDSKRERRFHVYVDGKSTSAGAKTFDGAMLYALARGNFDNPNTAHDAAWAMGRILGVES